jgi:catechol 2,3-dioxygenase-like lactoylglutathione lyase family enzyme
MPMTLGLVTLVVRDYDQALAWFTRVLGCERVEDTPLGSGKRWVVVRPRGSQGAGVLLARAANPEQEASVGRQSGGRVALFLHTDDFDRDHRAMSARGVTFLEAPRDEAYGRVAVFEDLYGNRWDLVEHRRDDLRRPAWPERRFRFGHPLWMLADFAERLRGTPPRLAALLATFRVDRLAVQHEGKWSILQNAGHLADVEELWEQRIADLEAGRATYTPARPERFAELVLRHTTREPEEILQELRERRARLVDALLAAPPELQRRSAFHERLGCDMRLVDCAQFVAEHDDHHVMRIRAIAAALDGTKAPPEAPGSTPATGAWGSGGRPSSR